jgi:hypothetical protein
VCGQPAQALIVGAPEELRAELRGRSSTGQVVYCARSRERPAKTLEHRITLGALRSTAGGVRALAAEAAELEAELVRLVGAIAPWFLELPGVGSISAAQVLVSWSYAVGYARRPPLLHWPACVQSQRPQASTSGIGSTAVVTASSTVRCTSLRWSDCATIPPPVPAPTAAGPTARARARSDAA